MKTFTKVCCIIALLILGAGIALTVAGCALGGADQVSSVVSDVTGGKVKVDLDANGDFSGIDIGGYSSDNLKNFVQGILDNKIYNIDDFGSIFDEGEKTLQGDVEKFMISSDKIEELKIDAGACEVTIKDSDDGDFWVEAKNVKKLQAFSKGDVLRVITTAKGDITGADIKKTQVTLYVPEEFLFDKVELEIGAGLLKAESTLLAKEMKLSVKAGEGILESICADNLDVDGGAAAIKIRNAEIGKSKLEIGAGTIELEGVISDDAKIKCGAGNVTLKLSNQYADFDYKIDCGMGSVSVGDEKISGMGKSKKIDNDADAEIEIDCGAGNVSVSFGN